MRSSTPAFNSPYAPAGDAERAGRGRVEPGSGPLPGGPQPRAVPQLPALRQPAAGAARQRPSRPRARRPHCVERQGVPGRRVPRRLPQLPLLPHRGGGRGRGAAAGLRAARVPRGGAAGSLPQLPLLPLNKPARLEDLTYTAAARSRTSAAAWESWPGKFDLPRSSHSIMPKLISDITVLSP